MKSFRIIFLLFLLVVVVYAGPGVSWIAHCSTSCESTVMQSAKNEASHDCCDSEKSFCSEGNETIQPTGCCREQQEQSSSDEHRKNCCTLQSLNFDWEAIPHHAIVFNAIQAPAVNLIADNAVPDRLCIENATFFHDTGPPRIASPREYLSFIGVLLI